MAKIKLMTGGKKSIQFGDFTYELKDGQKEIYDYLGFNREGAWFPKDHWEMTIIVNFGSMQSGKTTYNKGICEIGHDLFDKTKAGFECYQTNDLEFTLNYLNREEVIETRKKVIFLVFDDAMGDKATGMNSLKTFNKENKSFEEVLSMVRHKLANEDEDGNPDQRVLNGFCCLIFSIQSLKRLTTFVRDNAALCIYKTAYDPLEKEFSIEDFEFLKGITNDSDKHVYESRCLALGKSKCDTMKFYFPLSHFKIPILTNDHKEEIEKYSALMQYMSGYYIPDMTTTEIQAKIFMWGKRHGIRIGSSDMKEIVYELLDTWPGENSVKSENENKLTLEAIAKLREKGISPNHLSEYYEKSQAQLYRDLEQYDKRKTDNLQLAE